MGTYSTTTTTKSTGNAINTAKIIMKKNTYNNDDQLKALESRFDELLKKFPNDTLVMRACKKGCSPYIQHSKEYDISALNKFKEMCEKHGYFAYWEKPSWAYQTMQYLAVYRTEQQYNSNRSNCA